MTLQETRQAIVTVEGTPDIELEDVTHLFVPGRGRGEDGAALNECSEAGAAYAATLYEQLGLEAVGGMVICSGYKTPSDENGDLWQPPQDPEKLWTPRQGQNRAEYQGIPEAWLLRKQLVERGVGSCAVRAELNSTDTVSNFTYSEAGEFFSDRRPVGLVAGAAHLQRMMDIIAPRTLDRPYIGLPLPDASRGNSRDGRVHRLSSRYVTYGMHPGDPENAAKGDHRSAQVWHTVLNLQHAKQMLTRQLNPKLLQIPPN
jgi:hypothetical protein